MVVVLMLLVSAVTTAQVAVPDIDAEPLPGQLDIMQGTAVKLGGAPPTEGPAPTSYSWKIVQGSGGAIYNQDQYEAIFQAPKLELALELFVIKLTVGYPGGQNASSTVHIRVHRDAPRQDEPAKRSIEDVMTDYYRKEQAYREQNKRRSQSSSTTVIHHGYRGYHGGFGYGGWGWGWGWGWPAYYPVYAPIVVPPPGTDWGPGDGDWGQPIAVPYDEMVSTFPEHIADDYLPQDYPGAEPLPDMGSAGGSPMDFIDVPSGAGGGFGEPPGDVGIDPGFDPGMDFAEPMIDPGFGFDDFGW
jgi:hypothetical protein